jgi:transposase, IS5 family
MPTVDGRSAPQGAIDGDKGYSDHARQAAAQRNCLLSAIPRKNRNSKNQDRDRGETQLHAPSERVLAQHPKRVRDRGVAKNQFAAFLPAMVFNLKRLLVLESSLVRS